MIVSLEAIFLSTFVMISQNRADQKRQLIANSRQIRDLLRSPTDGAPAQRGR